MCLALVFQDVLAAVVVNGVELVTVSGAGDRKVVLFGVMNGSGASVAFHGHIPPNLAVGGVARDVEFFVAGGGSSGSFRSGFLNGLVFLLFDSCVD